MQYILIFDAKSSTSFKEIQREREEWIKEGRDKLFQKRCRSINRYEVLGISPLKIFFVVDTDDPSVLNFITYHFGDEWNVVSYPIIQREIYEVLEEDREIIPG
ncbi:hypothetical protein KKB84_03915 [bacterium]|nr:hypothetical protein [bacterium]MBU1153100.1 hypothetical protein [bacterium]MBU2600314.1 hypothetical protein [bacterium]